MKRNYMKKIFAGALVLALSIGAAQAQSTDQDKKAKKEHKMRGDAKDKLNLTAEQKVKLQAIREQQKKDMEAIRDNKALTAEQAQTRRKELHESYRSQFESILTPEQKLQAQKMQEERKAGG